ncbi:MAG: hypothetical protein WKF81_13395, partial [Thermomicrobiales bacterium]
MNAMVFGLPNLGGVLLTEMELENSPESVAGEQVIANAGLTDQAPTTETIVIQSTNGVTIDDPAFQAITQQVTDDIRILLHSWNAETASAAPFANYYELEAISDPASVFVVSEDRMTALIPVPFPSAMLDQVEIHDLMDRVDAFASSEFTVVTAGYLSINKSFTVASEGANLTEEAIGITT